MEAGQSPITWSIMFPLMSQCPYLKGRGGGEGGRKELGKGEGHVLHTCQSAILI